MEGNWAAVRREVFSGQERTEDVRGAGEEPN